MKTHDRTFVATPVGRLAAVAGGLVGAFDRMRAKVPPAVLALVLTPVAPAALALAPLVALFPGPADAADGTDPDESSLVGERARFAAARDALAAGDLDRFVELETSLADYPLHDYLVYARLRQRLRREAPSLADLATIEAFERASGDRTLAGRLVRTLQSRLASAARWEDFLALTRRSEHAAAMPCETSIAREATDPPDDFDAATLALWIDPGERSRDCAAALAALEGRAALPVAAVWERVYAAMAANRPDAARSVLRHLSSRDRRPVEGWIGALDDPVQHLASGALDADGPLNRRIIADLVLRWSREDTVAAMDYWRGARERFAFSEDLRHDTGRALAMRGAYRRMPEAQDWLERFEARADDLEFGEWRVRTALLAGDWDAVTRQIRRLPPAERREDHWAYWEARALEVAERTAEARAIYSRLATLQSWHGFLSAERIGREPAIEDVPVSPSPGTLERLAADPALVRAREYHRVGLAHEGRREWNGWLSGRDEDEAAAGAVLAARWGLDDRAIFSAARAGEARRRALSLRFPVLHRDAIEAKSRENDLEPSWVYGVARRESAFIADIRSSAGAIGLMQLMPATAQDVAGMLGMESWRGDLTDPATNIAFGTRYLRHVLDRFDGHQALATASYNAGPHRVKRWLPTGEAMESDRWIDTIPFTETRRYVRAVLAYAAIYEKRLSGEPYRLLERLPPVPSADAPVDG